jgi:methionine-rich copper-binding protein CopC
VIERGALAAFAAALAVTLAVPAAARAHAFLVKSAPSARATLVRAPDRVQLWFNERLEPAYSSISLWNAAGAKVDGGSGGVSAEDPRRLDLTVPALAPGRYVVRFRVLSVDGHVVESSVPFTVKGDGAR